jgi:hypothetical protein
MTTSGGAPCRRRPVRDELRREFGGTEWLPRRCHVPGRSHRIFAEVVSIAAGVGPAGRWRVLVEPSRGGRRAWPRRRRANSVAHTHRLEELRVVERWWSPTTPNRRSTFTQIARRHRGHSIARRRARPRTRPLPPVSAPPPAGLSRDRVADDPRRGGGRGTQRHGAGGEDQNPTKTRRRRAAACSCLLRDADGPMDRDARPTGRRRRWATDHPRLSGGQARIVAARHLPPRNKKTAPGRSGGRFRLSSD